MSAAHKSSNKHGVFMDDTDDKNDKINKATKNNSVHSYSILEATIVLWLFPMLCIYILYTWLITLI